MQVNHAAGKHPVPVDPELFELIQIGKNSLIPASHLNIARSWYKPGESVFLMLAFQITPRSRTLSLLIHNSVDWIL